MEFRSYIGSKFSYLFISDQLRKLLEIYNYDFK